MPSVELRNKAGQIVAHALFDEEDEEEVRKYTWHRSSGGYVVSCVNGQTVRMHRFLMKPKSLAVVIDHKDNNPLDNRRQNLRESTCKQNAQNRRKKDNLTSRYYGVSKQGNLWYVTCGSYAASYKQEIHAAWDYNRQALETYGPGARINVGVVEPSDFVQWIKPECKNFIRENIVKGTTYYTVAFKSKKYPIRSKGFSSLSKAITWRDQMLQERSDVDTQRKKDFLNVPIARNSEGVAIVPVYQKRKVAGYALVDDDNWREFAQHRWKLSSQGYVKLVKKPSSNMHRLVIGETDPNVSIDHVQNNKLDNRKRFLRRASSSLQAHNKAKMEGCYSKYLGVLQNRNKFRARVRLQGKYQETGSYESEEVAGWARDKIATKVYGPDARLNNVPQPSGWIWDDKRNRAVQVTRSGQKRKRQETNESSDEDSDEYDDGDNSDSSDDESDAEDDETEPAADCAPEVQPAKRQKGILVRSRDSVLV